MTRTNDTARPRCASCDKVRYSRNDATTAARRINHDQAGQWPVGPYKCPAGPGWHVGHIRTNRRTRLGRT